MNIILDTSLQPHCYQFVSRCGRCFNDGVQWVYSCTCSPHNTRLLQSLSSYISSSFSEFTKEYQECVHVTATIHFVNYLDAIHCLAPNSDFEG